MSIFDKIDNRDRNRWQITAADALLRTLKKAYKADLPPLRWSVSGLQLHGQVIRHDTDRDGDQHHQGDGLEVRDVFRLWADFIDAPADQRHEYPVGTGRIHLSTTAKAPGFDTVTVMISADIYQEDEQQ